MHAEQDWTDHCAKSESILQAVRSRAQLAMTHEQMRHLHSDAFVTFWYTADETVRVSYRLAYPALFAPAIGDDLPSDLRSA